MVIHYSITGQLMMSGGSLRSHTEQRKKPSKKNKSIVSTTQNNAELRIVTEGMKCIYFEVSSLSVLSDGFSLLSTSPKIHTALEDLAEERRVELEGSGTFKIFVRRNDFSYLCYGRLSKGKKTLYIQKMNPWIYSFLKSSEAENSIIKITKSGENGVLFDFTILDSGTSSGSGNIQAKTGNVSLKEAPYSNQPIVSCEHDSSSFHKTVQSNSQPPNVTLIYQNYHIDREDKLLVLVVKDTKNISNGFCISVTDDVIDNLSSLIYFDRNEGKRNGFFSCMASIKYNEKSSKIKVTASYEDRTIQFYSHDAFFSSIINHNQRYHIKVRITKSYISTAPLKIKMTVKVNPGVTPNSKKKVNPGVTPNSKEKVNPGVTPNSKKKVKTVSKRIPDPRIKDKVQHVEAVGGTRLLYERPRDFGGKPVDIDLGNL